MEKLFGIIRKDATVVAEDETIHRLLVRGMDKEGFREVLIDATDVDGDNSWHRQSIKPFIGMKVEFWRVEKGLQGFDFKILK